MPRTVPVSPDGERYLAMARGQAMPRPFMFRWLSPRLFGADADAWQIPARLFFAALCVGGAAYTRSWAGALIPLGLAGVTVQLRAPVLVDLHAMLYALCAAVCAQHGLWWAVIPWALMAGATKETAPIFAAAWAWSPIPLIGLLAPIVRALIAKPGPDLFQDGAAKDALAHPLRTAWNVHKSQPLAWWVLPWGALVIGLCTPDLHTAVVIVLAYGQCVIATDLVRLYQWAWPALASRTLHLVPARWWPLLVVLHICSPHKGEGW